jgi:hypothetical protein
MGVSVYWPPSSALQRRLAEIREAAGPNSRAANRVKGDLRQIVLTDNVEKLLGRGLLEGVDRYGRPLARMADSTFRNPKRGFGPVLAPRGLNSRFITHFRAEWLNGDLVMRYVNMVNSKGQPFAQYHLVGAPRGSKPGQPNWSLPRRDVGGITPEGWARIKARHAKYAGDVLRGAK